jgi:diguanylate cyclase (GGDEF)-like protein
MQVFAFVTRHRVRLIDVALFVDAYLMLTTAETVLFFHVVFVLLSLQAFYLRFRPFILRAGPWVVLTTMVVLRAVSAGSTQPDELIEIPLLSVILLTVFVIAARRERAHAELERTKALLERDIVARKELEVELAFRASHDPLTNLANREMFRERALALRARQRRAGGLFALMLLDLDDFKTVNDGLGHAAGDGLLVAVAERISDTMRGNDLVARLGGDEFVIMLDDVHALDGVTAAAERVLAALRPPFVVEGRQLWVSASIGIVISSNHSEKIEDHLRDADVAMYAAKSRGKARYEFFEATMHEAALLGLDLRHSIPAA